MNRKKCLLRVLFVVALAALHACQGCTIKFKGTDFDFEGRSTVVYEFDGVELTNGPYR